MGVLKPICSRMLYCRLKEDIIESSSNSKDSFSISHNQKFGGRMPGLVNLVTRVQVLPIFLLAILSW